jgi:cytochrome b561
VGEKFASAMKRYVPGLDQYELSEAAIDRRITAVVGQSMATIAAHWGTVLAIVISVIAIYFRDLLEDKVLRQFLLDLHRQLGLLVLIVVPLRLAARWWLGFTDHAGHMPAALRWSAKACHVLLYAALVITPILGWGATNAHRTALTFFGMLPLPNLVAADPDVADALDDYHTWGFYTLAAIVTLHVLAALWHHYVLRDGVLIAMVRRRGGRFNGPR